MKTYLSLLFSAFISAVIFGCGGSGGTSAPAPQTTSVSGVVLAGPAAGTTVIVKTAAGTEVARTAAPTDVNGAFTVAIPTSALSSDLIFEASGGSFTDEATATTGVALGTFTAHVAAGTLAAGGNVTIDPSSTIIQKLVAGGRTRTAAFSAFSSAFGYKPNPAIKPAFANQSSAAVPAERLAGLKVAAFSQLTKDFGLAPAQQSELLQALAEDLADGVLDGRHNGTVVTTASGTAIPEDAGNCFVQSQVTFVTGTNNKTGLTIDKIEALPFNTVALTSSYKVEYVPGAMAAAQGKTSFRIRVSNPDGTPATGKIITLIPTMYMASMSHAAPVDAVVESAVPGTYDCTVYYLMASGPGMGVWELKVKIGTETVVFYPSVAMSMGSTSRATLKGNADLIAGMMGMGTAKRTYYLFNEGLSNGTFTLFIAAQDDAMMMTFAPVFPGSTLHDQTGAAVAVSAMTVELSTDKATWIAATDSGNGHWSAAGLTLPASGGHLYARVTVNGEQKTTDGSAATATNGVADFTIAATGGM
ncbi:hypothetical protein [Geobacter sp. SVR]|uniref:hypothetical protein n=1 Tax=Geobacter sp. SVR TaxID=2495594 RepID=UPI00143F03D4|nr:hypothetical protein [Geobacter sp. SVR]BCS55336.1 hypothetical protein GSVR_36440 [Geobacter sp. SVR]GCF87261.1 hypothetical protein GSbR_38610 [Geobacter sp. SVR]